MKKILLSLVAAATLSISSFGQAPEGFKYQAVVRDAGNIILNNQAVGLRMTIQQGSIGGTTVYAETFAPTTNAYGLVNLEIGNGTVVSGTFTDIDWAAGPFYIETAVDVTGGTNYSVMGTSQLMSVPYALYAKTSGNGQGPVGPQGLAGEDGTNGLDGAAGPQGAQGIQGVAGINGAVGATGPQGIQGIDGPQGQAGNNGMNGANGLDGNGIASTTDNGDGTFTLTYDDGSSFTTSNLTGPQGATGAQGPQGPAGANGANGTNGTNGLDGNGISPTVDNGDGTFTLTYDDGSSFTTSNLTGPQGATGAQGAQGIQGIAGINGAVGATGPQGIQGIDGPQGPVGNNGTNGANGFDGNGIASTVDNGDGTFTFTYDDGSTFTTSNLTGATGPQGPQGDQGIQGTTGLLPSGAVAGNTAYWNGSQWVVNGTNFYNNGSNLGVGTTSPDASALADLNSTTQGFLPPRMTTVQRDAILAPAAGLTIYNTTENCLQWWNGTIWYDGCGNNAPAQPQYPAGAIFCASGATAIVDVTNPTTGVIWMDRNLGAAQVATSSTDANSYGDLYQWGRRADGHQCRNSATTSTNSSSDQPGHGNFILEPNSPYDWRSPQNTNLWQGVNGVNNPCPSGYRLPTETELNAERLSWSVNTSVGAFSSPLRLPMAGYRVYSNGSLGFVGTGGRYWSSTVSSTNSRVLSFGSSTAITGTDYRAYGRSVRCLKDASAIPPAAVGALNCGGATLTGNLYNGVVASGVSVSVPYTAGNGGSYAAQTISSTGVVGLTATLAAGTLANGAGSLTYTITGTPTTSGTASFAITVGGQSCTFTISVAAATPQYPAGTINCAGTTAIVDVTNPATGKIWMDRNLGATPVATSSTDAFSYGDLYQWGRRADGHQCRTSPTTATLSSVDQPTNGNFIRAQNVPYDWRSPQNANLWQGVNGVNNPCPSTYRLPTEAELNAERLSWSQNSSVGAFASPLKLPLAGGRNYSNGSLFGVGTNGYYWSSTVSGTYSRYLYFSSSGAGMSTNDRAVGGSVRCLKD